MILVIFTRHTGMVDLDESTKLAATSQGPGCDFAQHVRSCLRTGTLASIIPHQHVCLGNEIYPAPAIAFIPLSRVAIVTSVAWLPPRSINSCRSDSEVS